MIDCSFFSFAHAETILPLLSLLDAFPVTEDLKPDNYEGNLFLFSETINIVFNIYPNFLHYCIVLGNYYVFYFF